MKILHIIFSMNIGGAETMLVDLVNEQAKTELVELMVINDSVNKYLVSTLSDKVKIHYLKRVPGSLSLFRILMMNFLVFQIRPDVMHFHNHNAIRPFKYTAGKICLTLHTMDIPGCYLSQYHKLFSISNAVREDIFDRCTASSVRIYNGIDFTKIKAKDVFSVTGKFKIVQVSRLAHEIKGQHLLLKAFHKLVYEDNLSEVQLDFIGEGPSYLYLKKLTDHYNLSHCVRFLGAKDREFIYDTLHYYDLLIQPSVIEGFGLSIVEGIAAGLPVIVSSAKGPAEIVEIISGGWMFDADQEESLSKAIMEVIELYKQDGVEQLSRTNYLAAAKAFSIEQTAQSYIENYI